MDIEISYFKYTSLYMIGPSQFKEEGMYKVKYIHELQNLFEYITGHVLSIKED